MSRFTGRALAVVLAVLVGCTSSPTPTPRHSPVRPVPSEVLSRLRLRATPTPVPSRAASSSVVPETRAVATARAYLVRRNAWRSGAVVRASLARLTDFGLHDGVAWLVEVSGVVIPSFGGRVQRHVLVVIDATTGERRGDYSF